ncbi:hypothetical protein [Marmoricola sp. RAF53]|uniref:hypothetical protein n=1 Tax=Marmoricola sp. RAF53 TaxID=3233059 RepID=UPI003F9E342E
MSIQQTPGQPSPSPRTVSIPHLIFGVVFTGIAAVWAIGEATGADLPRSAIGFPAVLIVAGVVGLVATVVNARRRSQPVLDQQVELTETEHEHDPEPTVVLDDPGLPSTHQEK